MSGFEKFYIIASIISIFLSFLAIGLSIFSDFFII